MKKLFTLSTLLIALLFTNLISSENEIILGSAYANDCWYSFSKGVVKQASATEWDIAFQTFSQNAGIIINSAKGVAIYVVKNSDGDSWDSPIDTTGMASSWVKPNNSIEKWQIGAFNLNLDGFEADGDFGWGSYDMATHAIAGSKVFVIKLSTTSFKKIMIESLLGGVYTVLVANLDGSNEKKFTVKKSDYAQKLYTYYELTNNTVLDREPNYDSWDLVFSKYTDLIDMGNGSFTPYTVTGVRTHPLYRTAVVKGVPVGLANAPELNDDNYSSKITAIGSNWKKFVSSTYKIVDSLSYFTTFEENGKTDPLIQKIVFKVFEGSSTGRIVFELNGTTSVLDENLANSVSLFPTMIDKNNNIKVNFGQIENAILTGISIFSTNGNLVNSISVNNFVGQNFEFKANDLASGEYFVIFQINGANLLKKIIVK